MRRLAATLATTLAATFATTSALLFTSAAPPAAAQGFAMPEIHVELLSGGTDEAGHYLAGLRIALPEGWKTYWRQPGDSGIPPDFDWAGSENLAGVEVRWPAPLLIDDSAPGMGEPLWTIGYKHEVVLPLVVTPQTPGQPVTLALDLAYAVCSDVCVPADAQLGRELEGAGPDGRPIEAALAEVPQPPSGDLGIVSSEVVAEGGTRRLRVSARFPDGAGEAHLLVEGPPEWYLPVPEMAPGGGDGIRVFELDLPKKVDPAGVWFTATGLAATFSFEQRFRLD